MKKMLFILAAIAAVAAPAWACGLCPMGGMPGPACPPMGAISNGSKVAALLLSLAAGYAVLALAARQTRKLSLVGLVIGWFVIVVSVCGLACTAARALCARCHARTAVPAGACPYVEKMAAPAATAPKPAEAKAPVEKKK